MRKKWRFSLSLPLFRTIMSHTAVSNFVIPAVTNFVISVISNYFVIPAGSRRESISHQPLALGLQPCDQAGIHNHQVIPDKRSAIRNPEKRTGCPTDMSPKFSVGETFGHDGRKLLPLFPTIMSHTPVTNFVISVISNYFVIPAGSRRESISHQPLALGLQPCCQAVIHRHDNKYIILKLEL